jgi:hypothetical protein
MNRYCFFFFIFPPIYPPTAIAVSPPVTRDIPASLIGAQNGYKDQDRVIRTIAQSSSRCSVAMNA